MKSSTVGRLSRTLAGLGRFVPTKPLLVAYARMLDRAIESNDQLIQRLADRPAPQARAATTPRGLLDAEPYSGPANLDLHYFPHIKVNPYLELLYADCPRRGIRVQPLESLIDLPEGPGSVVHVHWTSRIQAGTATEEAAASRAATVLASLRDYSNRGGKVLWSVHEAMPHESQFPELERRFRAELATIVDAVHVLHPATQDVVRPLYSIDAVPQLHVPMPSYDGVYPNYVTREQARARLGIGDEFVLLAFGAIRPYKHFDRAIDALTAVQETGRSARLIIAGPAFASTDNAELFQRARANDDVVLFADAVPDGEIQYLFNAADLVVLPYTDFLNSAVLALAQAFRTPAIIPDNPATLDLAQHGGVYLYDSDDAFVPAVVDLATGKASVAYAENDGPRVDSPTLAESLIGLGWTTNS